MSDFAHLHCHDQFSFLDGFGKTTEYVEQVKEMGLSAFVQTNHGGLWGLARAWKACAKAGVKFIPGCEFFLDSDSVDKTQRRISWEHITVLAMTTEGYQNLLRLASIAGERLVGRGNRPILEYGPLFKHHEGLIVLSGCSSGKVIRLIGENEIDRASRVIHMFKKTFGDRYYIEIQPNIMDLQKSANPILLTLARDHGVKVVATNDVHYPKASDASVHEVMLCVQFNDHMANPNRWRFTWNGLYLADRATVAGWFREHHRQVGRQDVERSLDTVTEIVDRCNVRNPIPSGFVLPPTSSDPKATFLSICKEGFKAKGLDKRKNAADYFARLKYEAQVITKQNLHPYFLIVADLMKWARPRMLVGPGRGSSGGSLVCYCLSITDVDPLEHKTLFERFITEERSDLPDIDMDFPASRRGEVVEYLRKKYGENNVAGIATYIEFKGRLALRDVAKAYGVHISEINKVAPLIVVKSGGDARADMTVEDLVTESAEFKVFADKYPKVVRAAMRLEGITRQLGKHAAGIAITDKPCVRYFPTFRSKDGSLMSQWDKDDLEVLKLLKMDILGLDMLDTLRNTMDLIKARHGRTINIYGLQLKDAKVLAQFNEGNTVGVFQFESKGIAYWAKTIGITTFRDVVDVNALYRPGTLRSGTIKQYNLRKHGKQEWDYPHPYLKAILHDTYGIALYQEQLMMIFNRLADFPWRTADTVRKVVSKSQGLEAFDKYKEAFIAGCAKRGIEKKQSEEMFNTIRDFGAYGFNLSHAVEYSMISYWCMWMKVNYPLEYLSTLTSNEGNPDRVALYLKEAGRLGIEVLPPMVGKSGWNYRIEQKAIRIGMRDIKGVGEKAGRTLEVFDGQQWKDIVPKVERRVVNSRVWKALAQAGALGDLHPKATMRTLRENEWAGLSAILGALRGEKPKAVSLKQLPEYPEADLMRLRFEVLPINVGKHPLTLYADILKMLRKAKRPVLPIEALEWTSGIYYFAGVVTNIGHATVHRLIDGENKPKKLTYATLDGEREYMVMMCRGGPGEEERAQKLRAFNGQAIVALVEVNADRNKVYYINGKPLEEFRRG